MHNVNQKGFVHFIFLLSFVVIGALVYIYQQNQTKTIISTKSPPLSPTLVEKKSLLSYNPTSTPIHPTSTPYPTEPLPPYSQWKSYSNNTYHYTISYPQNFDLFFDQMTPYIMKPGGTKPGTGAFSFYKIAIEGFTSVDTTQTLIDQTLQEFKDFIQNDKLENPIKLEVAGQEALVQFHPCVGYCETIALRRNANIALRIIVIYSNKETAHTYHNQAEEIVKTLVFEK